MRCASRICSLVFAILVRRGEQGSLSFGIRADSWQKSGDSPQKEQGEKALQAAGRASAKALRCGYVWHAPRRVPRLSQLLQSEGRCWMKPQRWQGLITGPWSPQQETGFSSELKHDGILTYVLEESCDCWVENGSGVAVGSGSLVRRLLQ